MITASGIKCDICEKYILPIFNKSVHAFNISIIEGDLYCCYECKSTVQEFINKRDWTVMPESVLKNILREYTLSINDAQEAQG